MPDYDTGAPYRGVDSAITAITEKIEQQKEETKQRARQFDALLNYADASGVLPKAEGKVMSLEQLSGYMKGVVLKSARAEEAQKAAVTAEQLKQYQRQNAQAAQMDPLRLRQMLGETEQREALPGFTADMADFMEGYPTATPDQIMAYAAKNNPKAVTAGMLDDMLKRGGRGGLPSFFQDPKSGMRFAQFGNTFVPSGMDPGMINPRAIPVTDADGNVLNHVIASPRGGFQFVPQPGEANAALTDKRVEETTAAYEARLSAAKYAVEQAKKNLDKAGGGDWWTNPSDKTRKEVLDNQNTLRLATEELHRVVDQAPKASGTAANRSIPAPKGAPGNLPKVNDDRERDALPTGAMYIDKDGKRRQKR